MNGVTSSWPVPRDWSFQALRDVSIKIQDGTHFSPKLGGHDYKYVTSKNVGNGYLKLDSCETISAEEHRKIYQRCDVRLGDLLLTKDGANTGNAALSTFSEEVSLLSSVAFIRADHHRALEPYLLQYLISHRGRKQITDAMSGNAITRLTLRKINDLVVPIPPVGEQRAIAATLGAVDTQIHTIARAIAKKQAIKQGVMQQLLTGRTRLAGFSKPWEPHQLGELLGYEQPGPYLVSSTDYSPSGTPVLTAGKTFVLGYTLERHGVYQAVPVIIFDDFTTASKYVDFPFKAKSSAMKMLSAIPGVNLRYVYERMQLIDFVAVDHKRRWIGEYSKIEVDVPSSDEQAAIASVLSDADDELTLLRGRLNKARAIKQGMMQELLTGRTRLPVKEVAS